MKKFLKILAVAAIAVAAAIACVIVGCNKGSDGGNDYTFTIVYEGGAKDGQAVNGQEDGSYDYNETTGKGKVATQLCVGENCRPLTEPHSIFPDANGKLTLTQAKVNEIFGSDTDVTEFVFHVIGVDGYKHDCEVEVNGKTNKNYTVKVTAE
ncbi:MAG: hypothetical protein NC131_03735 [Roseburia sp.]|nr:hypothetical protein [Roseburia sp.]